MKIRLFKESDRKAWDEYVYNHPDAYHAHLTGWKDVIERAYKKKSYYLIAEDDDKIVGILPLFHIKSFLFGNSLVSMPYLTYGGVLSDSDEISKRLLEKALKITKGLKTDYLELRQIYPLNETVYEPEKTEINTSKVSMRLELPESSEELFNSFKAKLRSQIRRPQKEGMVFKLGGAELIDDFYKVFAVNMRDLGSPVHSKGLFVEMFNRLEKTVKVGVVYFNEIPVAAGIITLFKKYVEIPWASSLRKYNRYSPNMLLYWSFLKYVINIGYKIFDFGRSTPNEGTYKFKQQWGSKKIVLIWSKFPDRENKIHTYTNNNEFGSRTIMINTWSKLPLGFSILFGTKIRKNISL